MQIQQMLENRIEELETKIAFQEQLLDELNHALVQQQFDLHPKSWTKQPTN